MSQYSTGVYFSRSNSLETLAKETGPVQDIFEKSSRRGRKPSSVTHSAAETLRNSEIAPEAEFDLGRNKTSLHDLDEVEMQKAYAHTSAGSFNRLELVNCPMNHKLANNMNRVAKKEAAAAIKQKYVNEKGCSCCTII